MMTSVRSERKSSVRLPNPSETTLLLIIAAGFFVLHILTAVLLMPHPASADSATPPEASGAMFD